MASNTSFIFHLKNHLGIAVLSKLVPILSIFLYTRFMTTSDYGILNLYSSYLGLLAIVLTFNLHTAIGRYIYSPEIVYSKLLSTTFIAVTVISLLVFFIISLNITYFQTYLSLPKTVIMLMLVVAYGSIIESIFTQIAIFNEMSSLLLKTITIKAMGAFLISLFFLVVLKKDKFLAIFFADIFVNIVLCIYITKKIWADLYLIFDKECFKQMGLYSIPLIPYMLSLALLSQSDRIIINHFFGKSTTGLYSLAYNVGILLVMVISAILNTLNLSFYKNLNNKNYTKVATDSDAIYYIAVISTLGTVLFGADVISLIITPKYKDSFNLIPIVAIGGLCSALFQIWVRIIAYVKKTYLISIISTSVTIVNITLNILLIPVYGYKVAAVTTLLAYLLMALACMIVANKIVNLFRVNILRSYMYIVILGAIFIFFEVIKMKLILVYIIKFAMLTSLFFHLKPKILPLFQND